MDPEYHFPDRLKDIDLGDAAARNSYHERMFTVIARRYELISRVLSFYRDSHWKRALIRSLPPGRRVRALDLACGTADLTRALARRYPEGEVFGLDLTPGMLALARARLRGMNVHLRIGDMSRLEWADTSFDVVTGGYALRYAPDLEFLLREVHRVLKPGGTAAFLDFSKPANPVAQRAQLALLRGWGDLWGWFFHGNPEVYGYIAESLRRFPDRRRLLRLFSAAGFRDIRSRLFFGGFTELILLARPAAPGQRPAR